MLAHLLRSGEEIILVYDGGDVVAMDEEKVRNFFLQADQLARANARKHSNIKALNLDNEFFTMLAYVDDNYRLVISDMSYYRSIMSKPIQYFTAEEYAKLHGKKRGIVMRLCRERRLIGAIKKGEVWLIPENCPYPKDARVGTRVGPLY